MCWLSALEHEAVRFAVLSVGNDSEINPGNKIIWRNFNKKKKIHVQAPISDLNQNSQSHRKCLCFSWAPWIEFWDAYHSLMVPFLYILLKMCVKSFGPIFLREVILSKLWFQGSSFPFYREFYRELSPEWFAAWSTACIAYCWRSQDLSSGFWLPSPGMRPVIPTLDSEAPQSAAANLHGPCRMFKFLGFLGKHSGAL